VDQEGLFSYVSPEARVPANHPLRKIRELVLPEFTQALKFADACGPGSASQPRMVRG
jgi:hypothetical protein